jgi:hypothetical protein
VFPPSVHQLIQRLHVSAINASAVDSCDRDEVARSRQRVRLVQAAEMAPLQTSSLHRDDGGEVEIEDVDAVCTYERMRRFEKAGIQSNE